LKHFLLFTAAICLIVQAAEPRSFLPDAKLTPGVVDTNVTAEMLRHPAYIKAARNVPESEKKEVFRRYGIDYSTRALYEVDHLVPLCLSGKNDIENLWPQLYDGLWSARLKDRLEVHLHQQVNKGTLTLESAREQIRTNWTNAYVRAGFADGPQQRKFSETHLKEK
jgi:hypothetical protein